MTEIYTRPKHRKGISLSVNSRPNCHNDISNIKSSTIYPETKQMYTPINSYRQMNCSHNSVSPGRNVIPVIFRYEQPKYCSCFNRCNCTEGTVKKIYKQNQQQSIYQIEKNKDCDNQFKILQEKSNKISNKYFKQQKQTTDEKPTAFKEHYQFTFQQQENYSGQLQSKERQSKDKYLKRPPQFGSNNNHKDSYKQNTYIQKQARNVDAIKIALIESKLLEIIRVCEQGL